jgi:hypothetical protein
VSQSKVDPGVGSSLRVVSFARAAGVREAALAQQGGAVSTGKMSKGAKTAIFLTAAVGFFGIAWEIDHNVRDVTPSTLGTRLDK